MEISILGTIETMPEGYDVLMDEWMDGWRHRNSQKLIALLDCDLSQVFNDTLAEERVFLATKKIDQYDDNLLFDMFNLVVLDLALFAHRNDSFRQSMAAKRNLGCLTLVIAGLGLLALTIFAL